VRWRVVDHFRVFQALKRAANAIGLRFGPHSQRRANIRWRQEVGGSSIETSKIAGHTNTKMTEAYIIVQMKRQEELTRRIQRRRAKAAKPNPWNSGSTGASTNYDAMRCSC
jgi:integrase